jgi:ribosome-associated protein
MQRRKVTEMKIDTPYIKLDSFMKAVNAASSGGEAKFIITEGKVMVNGEIELRRGRKLYPGDRMDVGGKVYMVE